MPRLLLIQAYLLIGLGAIHLAALTYSLYWLFPWLDTGVHFLGGLWAMLAAHVLFLYLRIDITATRIFVLLACVAFGWELFELWAGSPREANFAFDTTIDLIMDSFGGLCGYVLAKHVLLRDKIMNHDAPQKDPSASSGGSA